MLPKDPTQTLPLIIALLVTVAAIAIADLVILVRWLVYQLRLQQAELEMATATAMTPAVPAGPVGELAFDLAAAPPSGVASAMTWPQPPFAPTWSLVHPFLGIQLVFGGLMAFMIAAMALLMLAHAPIAQDMSSGPMLWLLIVTLFLQNGLFVGVVALYIRGYGESLRSIGFRKPTRHQVFLAIGLGLAMFVVGACADKGLSVLLSHILPPALLHRLEALSEAADAGAAFTTLHSGWAKLLFALGGAVAAPIGEEAFFRGFVYNSLKRRLRVPAAVCISGLLFAIIHFNPIGLVVIFVMGMVLAYVYERTGSLWVTSIMHAINNGLSFAAVLLLPNLFK